MTSPRNQVLASIQQARAELETALSNLELLPAVDSRTIVFIAHALNNFLTVNRATSELLLVSLKDYPDPQVRLRLEGMVHVNKLMTNIASRLMSNSGTGDAQLLLGKADLAALTQTACEFYQRLADRKQISILFSSAEDVPSLDRQSCGGGCSGQSSFQCSEVFRTWETGLGSNQGRGNQHRLQRG